MTITISPRSPSHDDDDDDNNDDDIDGDDDDIMFSSKKIVQYFEQKHGSFNIKMQQVGGEKSSQNNKQTHIPVDISM